jgi:hypothetical protein
MEIGEAKMGDPVHQTLVLGRSMDPCMLKTPPVAAHLQTPAGASIALKSGIRRCRGTVPFAWRSSSAVFPARSWARRGGWAASRCVGTWSRLTGSSRPDSKEE